MHLVETQFYKAVLGLKPSYKANDIRYTDFSETQMIIVKASGRPRGWTVAFVQFKKDEKVDQALTSDH